MVERDLNDTRGCEDTTAYSAKNTTLISRSVLKFSDLFVNDANGTTSDLLQRANNLIRVAVSQGKICRRPIAKCYHHTNDERVYWV